MADELAYNIARLEQQLAARQVLLREARANLSCDPGPAAAARLVGCRQRYLGCLTVLRSYRLQSRDRRGRGIPVPHLMTLRPVAV